MFARSTKNLGAAIAVLALLLTGVSTASAQFVNAGVSNNVGGVSISPDGILNDATITDLAKFRQAREQKLDRISGDLNQFTPLRRVSLRGLEAALERHRETGKPLPQAVEFLAGLQSIRYVFVYPEANDIVLVGPAEGWKIDDFGNVVGVTTNEPVLLLDDLMVALRHAGNGAQCSIDPTQEGLARLQSHVKGLKTIGNPSSTAAGIEKALGQQVITVGGVPNSTHFARVMVAADFQMKQLAMNFEQAPVKGMPSFLHMAQAGSRGLSNMLPRWWLAPKTDTLRKSADGMSWELPAVGVQCMTEQDFLTKQGDRQQTGRAGALAEKWAGSFTDNYEELAKKQTVFGQLRNLIDLAIVSAIINREGMLEKAQLEVPNLLGRAPVAAFDAPKHVASKASLLKKGRNWLISVSGGVQIVPGEITSKSETTDQLAPVRNESVAKADSWWWN